MAQGQRAAEAEKLRRGLGAAAPAGGGALQLPPLEVQLQLWAAEMMVMM